ncbi:copper resistance D family protein [Paenibacillus hodogayensis]|uniref:Copper resistance D family protein n=1 Tax=Paenibacillus hodogayensis TaxID=279208 RepID=A0ABV5W252_9BACL
MYAYFSETLLYLCFAFVCGALLLNAVPAANKPDIRLPGLLLFNAVIGIALLSLVPVIKNTIFLTQFAGPFWDIIDDVLLDLEFGKAWLWMFGLCTIFLALTAYRDPAKHPAVNAVAGLLALGLLFAYGWASHAAGLSESWGFLAQTIHIAAASVWIGILLIAGWFARPSDNWLRFLRWFHPLAIGSVLLIVAAGLVLMAYIVPSYPNSWIVSYGQALLIKHLLLAAALVFGLLNGFLLKSKLRRQPGFDPRPWFRAESVVLTLVFAATAFMGMQRPPHDDPENPEPLVSSELFRLLHKGESGESLRAVFGFSPAAAAFGLIALVFLFLMLLCWKRNAPWKAASLGVGFAAAGFLSAMLFLR